MGEPHKNAPSPDATLVDPDAEDAGPTPLSPLPAIPVGKRPTNPELPITNPVTAPLMSPPPPAKRPTRSALPAQAAAAPPPPERNRTSGKRPPVSHAHEPAPDRTRSTGKRAVPHELAEAPTSLTPMAQAAPAAPQAKTGPSGTLDTDLNAMGDNPDATIPGDEPPATDAQRLQVDSLPPQQSVDRTHDFKPLSPTKTFAGLDEGQFRRAVWGLALGGLALISLTFVWVMVKFDDAPLDPGKASKIEPPPGTKPAAKPEAAPLVGAANPVMIEQTIDAGAGETRTVLAAAGTIRIVTDPEANAMIDGRELGVTPVLATLPAGKNSVHLENKKLGFKRTVTVDVVSNEQTAVRFAFSKGWVELDAPQGAKVLVDGKPVTGTHIQVWEGTHKVDAQFDDKKKTRATRTVEVESGMTTTVHFDAPSIADDD